MSIRSDVTKQAAGGMRSLRLDHFLPYRLSIASNLVSDAIASGYRARFGLSIAEWRLVAVLAEREALTQLEIGAATRMDKVTVSRAATALAVRGLIARAAHPGDGRARLLSLSAAGRALHAEIAPAALALEARLLAGFTPAEVERLAAMLRRLETAAERLASEGVKPG